MEAELGTVDAVKARKEGILLGLRKAAWVAAERKAMYIDFVDRAGSEESRRIFESEAHVAGAISWELRNTAERLETGGPLFESWALPERPRFERVINLK